MIIGNAALQGAIMALVSRDMMKEAEEIAERAENIELFGQPGFQKEFIKSIHISR